MEKKDLTPNSEPNTKRVKSGKLYPVLKPLSGKPITEVGVDDMIGKSVEFKTEDQLTPEDRIGMPVTEDPLQRKARDSEDLNRPITDLLPEPSISDIAAEISSKEAYDIAIGNREMPQTKQDLRNMKTPKEDLEAVVLGVAGFTSLGEDKQPMIEKAQTANKDPQNLETPKQASRDDTDATNAVEMVVDTDKIKKAVAAETRFENTPIQTAKAEAGASVTTNGHSKLTARPQQANPNFIASSKAYHWPKGVSGNPGGVSKQKKVMRDAYKKLLDLKIKEGDPGAGKTVAEYLAQLSLEMLSKVKTVNDFVALSTQIRDTAGEKPVQEIEIEDPRTKYADMDPNVMLEEAEKLFKRAELPKKEG